MPRERPQKHLRLCRLAALASLLAAGSWILAAGLSADRGFDLTDEGFYLLSYRWWSTELRSFTGAQFIYGPVFELLRYDIAGLRLFRLSSVVVSHVVFGWAFMRWLRLRRPRAPTTLWWETSGTAAILACGGMSYSWLPLSPGYNDVSLLGAMLAASIVLRVAADVERAQRTRFWVPMSFGPIAVAMVLAKWASSGLTLIATAVVAMILLAPAGGRESARAGAFALAGAGAAAAVLQFFVVRLEDAIPLILETNKLVAAGANNPVSLGIKYLLTFGDLAHRTVTAHAALLIVVIAAVLLRERTMSRVITALGVPAAGLSLWVLLGAEGFTGGNANIETYSVGLTLMLSISLIVALSVSLGRRHTSRTSSLGSGGAVGVAMVLLLVALPLAQGAGTGNPLYYMAFNGMSAWAALSIYVVTGIEGAPELVRAIASGATAATVATSAVIATNAMMFHPYRTSAPNQSTTVADGVPRLSSVRLSPDTAALLSELHRLVSPYLASEGGTHVMAFDAVPGLVFALDGRSVGESWYSETDRRRTAAGIRAACPNGKGAWSSDPPVLLFNRAVTDTEVNALKACGLDFFEDYRRLHADTRRLGLTVYVAASALGATGRGLQ